MDCQLTPDCSRNSVDSAAAISFDASSTATGTAPNQKPPLWKYCFSLITWELITSMCFPRFSRSRIYNMEVMLLLAHCFGSWREGKKNDNMEKNCSALMETSESLSTSLSDLLFHSCSSFRIQLCCKVALFWGNSTYHKERKKNVVSHAVQTLVILHNISESWDSSCRLRFHPAVELSLSEACSLQHLL